MLDLDSGNNPILKPGSSSRLYNLGKSDIVNLVEFHMEPKPVIWTIYCHTHTESGRRYVGLTKLTMMKRWNSHVNASKKVKKKGWSHFANAIRKNGPQAFTHQVLNTTTDLDDANFLEERWIELLETQDPRFGFNIKRGGAHVPHPIRNPWDRPEFRIKGFASLAKANASVTPAERSAKAKELWQDQEYREKVVFSSQTVTKSPEFREAMSKRVKEIWKNPELRKKFEEVARKRAQDPKLREFFRRKWNDPDFRERCSSGVKAANEIIRSATHCKRGHPYNKDDSTPSGWARECHICANERRKATRTHCPKGHQYMNENVIFSKSGRRMCSICLAEVSGPRPCIKCGSLKIRHSGNKFRCGPCTDARISAWKIRRGCVMNHTSSAQRDIARYIESFGLEVKLEYEFDDMVYDIFVPTYKLLIEYNGLRWHSLRDRRKQEFKKYQSAISSGYEHISLFEDEWVDHRSKVENLLRNKLNLHQSKSLRPSECDIELINSHESNSFYELFHYIGKCNSRINYGVFYQNQLIAAVSFSNPTRQTSKHPWELIRMGSDPAYRVHGIWSKLLKKFIQDQNPASIVSFSDNRLFSGKVYQKIGFRLDGDVRPDYYWVKGNKRFHKSGLRKKGSEKTSGLTETVLRTAQGYQKIWDLGKKRWVIQF